jgi:hypothetical protein
MSLITTAASLLLLVVVAVVHGSIIPLKSTNFGWFDSYCQMSKSPKGLPDQCPYTTGGFHILCGAFPSTSAPTLCQQYGYRLAALTDENILYALQVHRQCNLGGSEWTAAFNGLNRNPCQGLFGNGTVVVGGVTCSQIPLQAVLCEEVPVVETDTVTVSTTFTTSDGTETVRTTTTRYPECHHDKKQQAPANHKLVQVQGEQPPKLNTVCNTCNPVCSIPDTDLKVIKHKVSYQRAAAECNKYGWTLADITDGVSSFLAPVPSICGLNSTTNFDQNYYWIRSYDGVSGGYCPGVLSSPNGFGVFYPYAQADCEQLTSFGVYPLCQCGKPAITGNGPYTGTVTTTTETSTTVLVTVVPETTVTVTSTVCRRCHRHHRSSSSGSSDSSNTGEESFF